MNDFWKKLSSYNLFNFLIPGVVFAILVGQIARYSLIQPDIVTGAFLYYFIGLCISRFGSLVIEPPLRRISFLHFTNYADFVTASKKDDKLELLSEVNNTYRTISAMCILLLLVKLYEFIEVAFPVIEGWRVLLLVALLLIMFLLSYRKQTEYITKRIKANQ